MAQGALIAAAFRIESVLASNFRTIEAQAREIHQLLGKKVIENELLFEGRVRRRRPKLLLCSTSSPRDGQ